LFKTFKIFGWQVLRLLNEPSAAAVAYGLYRTSTDLPNADQPPRHVAFVDFGSSALQVIFQEICFHSSSFKFLAYCT
jgi:molecular chaperone DnaK (HSP70)